MKRVILLAFVCLLASVSAFAGGIKVTSGNSKVFKNEKGCVLFEVIWDNATYDDKMPLAEHFENLEELRSVAWDGFKEEFDDNSKGLVVLKDSAEAVFKITMTVSKMDQYVKVTGFIPAPATKVWGVLTITDLRTNEVVTTVAVDAVNGGANPSPDGTFSDCFEELGKQVAKLR